MNIRGTAIGAAKQFLTQWNDRKDYIVAHTSGSTGVPKAIRLKKSDMQLSAHMTCKYFEIKRNGLMALPLSVDYIAGKMQIIRTLERDCDLWVEIPSSFPLSEFSSEQDIELVPIVPAQITGLLKSPAIKRIKSIIVGGAPLSIVDEKLLIDRGINAFCTYGMTETCSHVALRPIGKREFIALHGIAFSTDSRGCLCISCPNFSFKEVVTNDLVDLIDEHHFVWRGRIDNVVISGGIKLHPEIIESKIADTMGALTYYVTSRPSQHWGRELILIVESTTAIQDLQEKLREILTRYEIPKEIIYQPQLPRTASGKIIRQKF